MMKNRKTIYWILSVCLLVCIGFTSYYFSIISSKGSATIRYIEPEAEYMSFGGLLNDPLLKNKMIYVDYWHTGCSPCIQEFPYLSEIKKEFKEEKDLVFLYLGKDRSAPGEKFRWKKMIEEKNLTGVHYFITDEQFDLFWNETVADSTIMKAFPHYLIVNKKGNIINKNAPRPSSDILKTELVEIIASNN